MYAVLKSALQDITSHTAESAVYRDAYKWCMGIFPYTMDYVNHVFSVDTICLELHIDKARLRKLVEARHVSQQ